MKYFSKTWLLFIFAVAFGALTSMSSDAQAFSSFFSSNCAVCHSSPVTTSCNGCHHHGPVGLKGTTNKTSYAPGETVSVTVTGGSQSGWIRAILYNEKNQQVAISGGNDSGMGHATTYPAVLSAAAPTTPGTYTWKAAWFGNSFDSGNMTASSHGEVAVNTNSFTVLAPADTSAPVVGTFTLPATSTSLTVPVSALSASDNLAVTGYLVTTSSAAPAASAAGWSATAPASVTAPGEGTVTFFAWAKDAAGNVSAGKSASVVITLPAADLVLTVSTLADASYTNEETLNVSGIVSDAIGIQSVTVNGQPVDFAADGSFSTAVTLEIGSNALEVIATDAAGTQKIDSRTITYDPNSPELVIAAPADNSTTTQSFLALTGTISETSDVLVNVNGGEGQLASIVDNAFSATVYLVPGLNTISVTATDLAGNVTLAKRTVTLESGSLSLEVNKPSQDLTTRYPVIELAGKVSDAVGTPSVLITMAGRTFNPRVERDGEFDQRLVFTKPGLYVISLAATDEAGNSSSVIRNVIYQPIKDRRYGDDDRTEDRKDD